MSYCHLNGKWRGWRVLLVLLGVTFFAGTGQYTQAICVVGLDDLQIFSSFWLAPDRRASPSPNWIWPETESNWQTPGSGPTTIRSTFPVSESVRRSSLAREHPQQRFGLLHRTKQPRRHRDRYPRRFQRRQHGQPARLQHPAPKLARRLPAAMIYS